MRNGIDNIGKLDKESLDFNMDLGIWSRTFDRSWRRGQLRGRTRDGTTPYQILEISEK